MDGAESDTEVGTLMRADASEVGTDAATLGLRVGGASVVAVEVGSVHPMSDLSESSAEEEEGEGVAVCHAKRCSIFRSSGLAWVRHRTKHTSCVCACVHTRVVCVFVSAVCVCFCLCLTADKCFV